MGSQTNSNFWCVQNFPILLPSSSSLWFPSPGQSKQVQPSLKKNRSNHSLSNVIFPCLPLPEKYLSRKKKNRKKLSMNLIDENIHRLRKSVRTTSRTPEPMLLSDLQCGRYFQIFALLRLNIGSRLFPEGVEKTYVAWSSENCVNK